MVAIKNPKPERRPKIPKIEVIALAATGLLVFGGLFSAAPAFAEDDEFEQHSDEESSETELKHQELEEKYGKDSHLTLPPLVIRPEGYIDITGTAVVGGAGSFVGQVTTDRSSSGQSSGGQTSGGQSSSFKPANGRPADRPTETVMINPEKNIEIDISAISPATKTPADVFLDSATTGLVAMGFGAVGLGAVAGVRAIRRR